MRKYEYQVVKIHPDSLDELHNIMGDRGKNGWKLLQVIMQSNGHQLLYWERELSEEKKEVELEITPAYPQKDANECRLCGLLFWLEQLELGCCRECLENIRK